MKLIGLKEARKGGCYIKKFVSSNVEHRGKDVDPSDPNCKHRKMFYAIITDGKTSGFFRVYGAKKVAKESWEVVLYDGSTMKIKQEPIAPREISGAELVRYDKISETIDKFGHFEEVKKCLKFESWHLRWEADNGKCYRSSGLVKLWKDKNGTKHAMTETGSHYVF